MRSVAFLACIVVSSALAAIVAPARARAAEFRVEGETLFLDGEITRGDLAQFSGMLTSHPDVKRLSINSPGGDLDTGLRIGEMVRKRKLETYVEGGLREAASAAAYIFMGGETRIIKGTRGVGVHAFYSPAAEVRKMIKQKSGDELVTTLNEFERRTQESTMAVVEYVLTMIGDTRIVGDAVKSGSDAMLWPDAKRLLALKVVTKVVDLSPEEIPDLDWLYGEVIAGLGGWLDPRHDIALDDIGRTLLEDFLASDAKTASLRDDLGGVLERAKPASRAAASAKLIPALVNGIVEQIRVAAKREDTNQEDGRGGQP